MPADNHSRATTHSTASGNRHREIARRVHHLVSEATVERHLNLQRIAQPGEATPIQLHDDELAEIQVCSCANSLARILHSKSLRSISVPRLPSPFAEAGHSVPERRSAWVELHSPHMHFIAIATVGTAATAIAPRTGAPMSLSKHDAR